VVGVVGFGAAASASAETPLEGIWSFEGGKVAIVEQPDGSFDGIVVSPTKFALCVHEVGETMWTGLTEQADGSFWGMHRWFFDTGKCQANPDLGPTAWRLLEGESGDHYLKVCFSEPGSDEQPMIAADGEVADVTYGCFDSAHIGPLPDSKVSSFAVLPASSGCVSRNRMRIRVHDRVNDPLRRVRITLTSTNFRRAVKVNRRGASFVGTADLTELPPESSFTVIIKLRTVLGKKLSAKRTYNRCTLKSPRSIRR